jgi:uncharacterized membrane protein
MLKTFGLYAMALLYVAAGINHFVNPDFYANIMPHWLPAHGLLVALSGVAEVILGVALLVPKLRPYAAWGIMAMLTVFFAVHIDMLVNHARYEDVPYWGLVVRIPVQVLLIAWAYVYTRATRMPRV